MTKLTGERFNNRSTSDALVLEMQRLGRSYSPKSVIYWYRLGAHVLSDKFSAAQVLHYSR